jgi:hypothetical protein
MQDWTSAFRQCASVREYVLVGEIDDGACGHPWKTWGHEFTDRTSTTSSRTAAVAEGGGGGGGGGGTPPATHATSGDQAPSSSLSSSSSCAAQSPSLPSARRRRLPPPFELDGWRRHELPELSALQLCQFDEPWQMHAPRMGADGVHATHAAASPPPPP